MTTNAAVQLWLNQQTVLTEDLENAGWVFDRIDNRCGSLEHDTKVFTHDEFPGLEFWECCWDDHFVLLDAKTGNHFK